LTSGRAGTFGRGSVNGNGHRDRKSGSGGS
jgi:hypothetical protein